MVLNSLTHSFVAIIRNDVLRRIQSTYDKTNQMNEIKRTNERTKKNSSSNLGLENKKQSEKMEEIDTHRSTEKWQPVLW